MAPIPYVIILISEAVFNVTVTDLYKRYVSPKKRYDHKILYIGQSLSILEPS